MAFVIIGGGVGGCGAALELADAGYPVTLIERKEYLLSGSSDTTPCRLGLGFHYADSETALHCLKTTIHFIKKYRDFILAKDLPEMHPYRRTRYFVVKDSSFSLDHITTVYDNLRKEYIKLISEDPSNEVLGPADVFCRPLSKTEYSQWVNEEIVVAGFETAEQVLNWPIFKEHIAHLVEHHSQITVYKNTEVIDVKHSEDDTGFDLEFLRKCSNKNEKMHADFIINSSWHNIDSINRKVGIFMPPNSRTNRVKAIAQIKLPPNFEKSGPVNHMFFCFGPHCAFTNMGDNTAFITYEPVTNVEYSTECDFPQSLTHLMDGLVTEEEKQQYGQGILAGAIKYIPNLNGATVSEVRFGNVRTNGTVNISTLDSGHHSRRGLGVTEKLIDWIDNPCLKLVHFLENAACIKKMIGQHALANQHLTKIVLALTSPLTNPIKSSILEQVIRKQLQIYHSTEELINHADDISNKMAHIVEHKSKLRFLQPAPTKAYAKFNRGCPH